jgi:hypothetical protein
MSNMMKWAENELRLAGYPGDEDGPNKWIYEGTLDLLKVFTEQGHSGMSAPYAISLFKRLANLEPISPLTGEDDEWREVGDGYFQNRRASNVFKNADGPYWMGGIVFWEWCTQQGNWRAVQVVFHMPRQPRPDNLSVDHAGST